MYRKIFNRLDKKKYRASLRNEPTDAETKLWDHLRKRQMSDMKFRRQQGIGNYIVDFYCSEIKLVIEVDGDTHQTIDEINYDRRRDEYLNSVRCSVIRFTNQEIYLDMENVLEKIKSIIGKLKDI